MREDESVAEGSSTQLRGVLRNNNPRVALKPHALPSGSLDILSSKTSLRVSKAPDSGGRRHRRPRLFHKQKPRSATDRALFFSGFLRF